MTACAKVGILFPNGYVSKLLATKLLQTNHNVVFYCPEEEDFKECKNKTGFYSHMYTFFPYTFHLQVKKQYVFKNKCEQF